MLFKFNFVFFLLFTSTLCLYCQQDGNYFTISEQEKINQELLLKVESGDTAAVKAILEKGANVNTSSYEGVTPLMFSVIFGFYDLAQLLVYYGADVNKTPYDGKSPLMIAAENNDIETGELLILNKASLSQKDKDGNSAIHYAVMNGNYYFTDMLLFYEAFIEETTKDGSTSLMLASFYGMKDIAELLITSGAEIETKDDKGFTPLMAASQQGHTQIVKLLVHKGCQVDTKNKYGLTALCYAVKNGHQEIIETLIENGADYHITFDKGYNLVYLADKNNHYEVKKYLKEKGINNKTGFICDKFNIHTGFNFSPKDIMIELSPGFSVSKIHLNCKMIYMKRLGYSPVLEIENEDIFQYYENRSWIGFNIEKEYKIYEITNLKHIGFIISVQELFGYGKFRAMEKKPKGKFALSPSAGIFYRQDDFFVRFQYQYLNTGMKDFPVSRFSLTTGFDLLFKKNIIKEKTIYW